MADRRLESVEDVRAWLTDLHKRQMLWHMDDDPLDCVWDKDVSLGTKRRLRRLRDRACAVTEAAGVDIFELYPTCSACGRLKGSSTDCETCAEDALKVAR